MNDTKQCSHNIVVAVNLLRTILLFSFVCVLSVRPASACGFIEDAPKAATLREEALAAKIVLYGTITNVQRTADGGHADFIIAKRLKDHPLVAEQKVLRIPRYVNVGEPKKPVSFVIFADVVDGKLDCYRGDIADTEVTAYLAEGMKLDPKERMAIMRYCFDFLEHNDRAIADDAFNEFLKSTDSDIQKAAKPLKPEPLRTWLADPKTPWTRMRLYAYLLANCGHRDDAALLRTQIERCLKPDAEAPLIDGLFTGYALLCPKEGGALLRDTLRNPNHPFHLRYSCLRAIRYFHNTQPDVLAEEELLTALRPALEQSDFADLVIDDLRKWRCWKYTETILTLTQKKELSVPLIQRVVLRYALQCPDPAAAQYVATNRKRDPEWVAGIEEAIRQR